MALSFLLVVVGLIGLYLGGDLLVRGIGELATNDNAHPGTLGVIETAAMAMRDGRVVWTGPETDLPAGLGDLPEQPAVGFGEGLAGVAGLEAGSKPVDERARVLRRHRVEQ